MTRKKQAKSNKKKIIIASICGVFAFVVLVIGIYLASYYRADNVALDSLKSTDIVSVEQYDNEIWFTNLDRTDDLLVFYPGARVEYRAYAPLMSRLAKAGLSCVVVKMPFNFAILNQDAFKDVVSRLGEGYRPYEHLYIGGHSMGGAMAAKYAAEHPEGIEGLVMLAAYPTAKLPDDMKVLEIYGSNDGVINREKISESAKYLPSSAIVYEISGGNHAQFGSYGEQKGDGKASISVDKQLDITVQYVMDMIEE